MIIDTEKMDLMELTEIAISEIGRRFKEEKNENNIFYNEKYMDYIIAKHLNLIVGTGTQGADALDEDGNDVELKTINMASKSKGSFQFHWLSKNKLDKYKKTKTVYFIYRFGPEIVKIIKCPMEYIFPELLKRAKEKGTDTFDGEGRPNTAAHWSISLEKSIIENYRGEYIDI